MCSRDSYSDLYAHKIDQFINDHGGKYLSKKKFHEALHLYEMWRRANGCQWHPEGYDILYFAVDAASRSRWKCPDSDDLHKLFFYIFQVDSHFGRILFHTVSSAEYFLSHAYHRMMLFGGQRVLERDICHQGRHRVHPCELAITQERPDLLHLFLRYGGLTTERGTSGKMLDATRQSLRSVLSHDPPIPIQTILCAKLMLRAAPQSGKDIVDEATLDSAPSSGQFRWTLQHVLPELGRRMFFPATLKHACKMAVRWKLHENWQLPRGIQSLDIPQSLMMYLDLQYD